MPRPSLRPLDYVTIITRLPLHMHAWFCDQADRLNMKRALIYMYALRFAFQSDTEFASFLDAIKEGKVTDVTNADTRPASDAAGQLHATPGVKHYTFYEYGVTPRSRRKGIRAKSDTGHRR